MIEQPKKKISFKANKTASAPTVDKIPVLFLTEKKWEIVEAKGKIPSPRNNFKCLMMGPCMILFGGKAKDKQLNEVFALNCSNWTWKKLFSLEGPPIHPQSFPFKISEEKMGLIVGDTLWILQLNDVKWDLNAN